MNGFHVRRLPMKFRPLSLLLLLISMCCLPALNSHAQEGKLALLYKDILGKDSNENIPKLEEITPMLGTVESMDVLEIKEALPWMERAMNNDDLEVQKYGELGLWAISRRTDSAALLSGLTPQLIGKLHHPDSYIARGAIVVLYSMKPTPPESVIDEFMQELHDVLVHEELGPAIVFGLLVIDYKSKRLDIAQAIQGYLHRNTLTSKQRIDTLNAIAAQGTKNADLLQEVATNLSSQDEEVKISAIRALRMGGEKGMARGKDQIEQIATSSTAGERLRQAAREALQSSPHP